MCKVFELVFFNVYIFVGVLLCFFEVDRVDFIKFVGVLFFFVKRKKNSDYGSYLLREVFLFMVVQVDVGNFFCLKLCILYMEVISLVESLINIEVVVYVISLEFRFSEVS